MTAATKATARVPRAIELSPPLASLLADIASRDGQPLSGHVEIDKLIPVEVTVGHQFADDLLAAFALSSSSLRASHGIGLANVVGHSGRLAASGMRGDLIGIACHGDDEFAIDKRTAAADHTELLRFAGGEKRVAERFSLLEFLRRVAGNLRTTGAAFEASLHRPAPMSAAPGRVVEHKVFGRGTAFSEKGDGPTRKVTCDFPGRGLKVIQARFLTFIDS